MSDVDSCRLCNTPRSLCDSHVVPAFVYRWQKDTSSTGYLRFGQNINLRVQDGPKPKLLCDECESILNACETQFATRIFLPFHEERQTTFEFDDWMFIFCVSVSWRVLTYLREQGLTSEMEIHYKDEVNSALATWAAFLRGERVDIGPFEQHLIPLGPIKTADGNVPENFQRYLMRAVEIDRIWTQQSAFTFAKLGRFVIIGFIREPESDRWKGTFVNIGGGQLAPRQLWLPDWLLEHLTHRAEAMAELQSGISSRQRESINKSQRANPTRVLQSETFRALMEDRRLQAQRKQDR